MLKVEGTVNKYYILVDKTGSIRIWVNNYDTAIHVQWNWVIKEMNGRWCYLGFSQLEWKFTDKLEGRAGMIHVVMNYSRHICPYSCTGRDIYINSCIHIYISLFCQPRGYRSNNILVTKSTLRNHILILNTLHSSIRGTRLPREMPDSKMWGGNVQISLQCLVIKQ